MQKRTTTVSGARRIGPDVARAETARGSIVTASTMPRATIEMRSSKHGRYLSLTVTLQAKSREQLDALYSELSGHPLVIMVL